MYGGEVDIHYADDATLLLPRNHARNCHHNATALAVSRPYGCTDPLGPRYMYPACILHVSIMSPFHAMPTCLLRFMSDRLVPSLDAFNKITCNSYVSSMYLECIPHVSSSSLQILVSRMYSTCISLVSLHLRYVPISGVWIHIYIREPRAVYVFQNAYPALPHVSYMYPTNIWMYMYPACIPHIFCMYLACILIVS